MRNELRVKSNELTVNSEQHYFQLKIIIIQFRKFLRIQWKRGVLGEGCLTGSSRYIRLQLRVRK